MISGLLCDLDGVVYRGDQVCEGAVDGLQSARDAGVDVLFMTNNASRTPEMVARHLTELGVRAAEEEILTASQVAAEVLGEEHPELLGSAPVLAVGGEGVARALRDAGFAVISPEEVAAAVEQDAAPEVGAVVQGYGPRLGVTDLTEAAYAVRAGVPWIATNDDATLPTARGLAPGNGSLVAAVAHATGRRPRVVGKPHRPAYVVGLRRLGHPREQTLMVGDRLETDIAGARAAGLPSALVLTGVSERAEAEAAPDDQRPDHVASTLLDLAGLWGAT
ncbi:HAD-IIA family hydrolase [uncultured Serinicoccus sp.]|uniref:HAD-IIA family hydrolase n=1 Tax=uncultured Serinicoccus sp. TaxID=735514 RepID=UPI002634615A|nr:HAD-IIA family hydrolase [uncultured Serinicoccus sp.]